MRSEHSALDRPTNAITQPEKGGSASPSSEYDYDEARNLKLNHTFSPETSYTNEHMRYSAANEICKIATTKPTACPGEVEPGIAGDPTYDKDGDMTSDGSTAPAKFAYTERDQLSSITPHGGSATKIVSHGTGQEDLAAIGEEEVITNVLGPGITGSGESAKYYTRGPEGALLAKRTAKGKPSETEYYLGDPFGSPAMLTNSAGSKTAPTGESYQYDSYGSSIGTAPSTFGYRGGQILPDSLVHVGARYYDPAIGGWTQGESLGEEFRYAGDDPVNALDTSGRNTICHEWPFCGGNSSFFSATIKSRATPECFVYYAGTCYTLRYVYERYKEEVGRQHNFTKQAQEFWGRISEALKYATP